MSKFDDLAAKMSEVDMEHLLRAYVRRSMRVVRGSNRIRVVFTVIQRFCGGEADGEAEAGWTAGVNWGDGPSGEVLGPVLAELARREEWQVSGTAQLVPLLESTAEQATY